MEQKPLNEEEVDDPSEKEETQWELDPEPASDDIKLEVGDSIIGTLDGKEEVPGIEGRKQIRYELHILGEEDGQYLYGTKNLNSWMKQHKIGDLIKVERIKDGIATPPRKPKQFYKVYSPKR